MKAHKMDNDFEQITPDEFALEVKKCTSPVLIDISYVTYWMEKIK